MKSDYLIIIYAGEEIAISLELIVIQITDLCDLACIWKYDTHVAREIMRRMFHIKFHLRLWHFYLDDLIKKNNIFFCQKILDKFIESQ